MYKKDSPSKLKMLECTFRLWSNKDVQKNSHKNNTLDISSSNAWCCCLWWIFFIQDKFY